jgi:hypothetical protein
VSWEFQLGIKPTAPQVVAANRLIAAFSMSALSPMRSSTGLTPKIGHRPGKLTRNGRRALLIARVMGIRHKDA